MLMQQEMCWATVIFSLICVCVFLCVYCVVCMFLFFVCGVCVCLCVFGPRLAELVYTKVVCLCNTLVFCVCDMGACIYKCVCVCECA